MLYDAEITDAFVACLTALLSGPWPTVLYLSLEKRFARDSVWL